MTNDYIRQANDDDLKLISNYFKLALAHYEEQGELLAIQDIKYFIQNMNAFRFFLKEHDEESATYVFEFPLTADGQLEMGELTITYGTTELH